MAGRDAPVYGIRPMPRQPRTLRAAAAPPATLRRRPMVGGGLKVGPPDRVPDARNAFSPLLGSPGLLPTGAGCPSPDASLVSK